uniref:Uncharacterized protein n=1 Tax=viral metagenome TaxID=1070528 RepID=A0A6C0K1Z2_9ZZZZ
MNALRIIIQKFFNQDKIFMINKNNQYEFCRYIYSNNYINNPINNLFYYYFFNLHEDESDFDMHNNISKKFNCINTIIENMFVSESQKNEILEMFSRIQRVYYSFVKLAQLYKFKKATIQVTTDLCMNDLNPKSSNVFIMHQNNSIYYFSIKDLINILNRNLSNCIDFAPEPIITKNPYNNLMLTNAELYNIYFFMRWNNCAVPELFHGYFVSNFNMKTFRYNYEFNIINTYIKNYIYNAHHDTLYPIFKDMFLDCRHITKKLRIDEEFPKDKLMNIMKPYLHLYYTWIHATNGTYKQCNAEYTLKRKLRLFISFNQKFGRKYCIIKRVMFNKRKNEHHFNDAHMNFYKEYNPSILNKKSSRRIYVYEEDGAGLDGENIVYGGFQNFLYNYHYYNEPGERPRSPSVETPVLDSDEEDDENEVPDLVYNFDSNVNGNVEYNEDEEEKEDDESIS